jgi:hypothetical protein
MAKRRTTSQSGVTVTAERAGRLFRLVTLLGQRPQTRDQLTRRLGLGVRDFYRDLNTLEKIGIGVVLEAGRYRLTLAVAKALSLLPFPDPGLTLGEAERLAKGRTAAHQKLPERIEQFKSRASSRRRR